MALIFKHSEPLDGLNSSFSLALVHFQLQLFGLLSACQYNVEARSQFPDPRLFDRIESNDDRIAVLRIPDASEYSVPLVFRFAFHVTLRDEILTPLQFDGEVDVSRAPAIPPGVYWESQSMAAKIRIAA